MNRNHVSAIAAALIALSATQVFAADGPKTRDQVRAELAEAIRTGNMPANGESGVLLNQVNPGRYAPQNMEAGKTRAEVKAELMEALRTGDVLANNETGEKLKDLYPGLYPTSHTVSAQAASQLNATR
ncbi:DUF4148 domain-containing protein [Hydrogenophaga sp. D2P1]|uniref:DUF4148 domain-containing protein n=1 Tax=Hydrogenophaga aromaticivorans TaxID=2610898 RepID=A0A7Y8KYB3_9BURK|nr:DUF4148 domain-containing protein [Hydrogenophaga aromaticivorans]NWF47550.1 DUF4148 domain-containing protein [Hydrogenophaga aromaticivorans]